MLRCWWGWCRLSVLDAITSAQQRLKLFSKVPQNGLVLYTGTVQTEEGKEKRMAIAFEPLKPINKSFYLCDSKFHTEVPHRQQQRTITTESRRQGRQVDGVLPCVVSVLSSSGPGGDAGGRREVRLHCHGRKRHALRDRAGRAAASQPDRHSQPMSQWQTRRRQGARGA